MRYQAQNNKDNYHTIKEQSGMNGKDCLEVIYSNKMDSFYSNDRRVAERRVALIWLQKT